MRFLTLVLSCTMFVLLASIAPSGSAEHGAKERHSIPDSMHTIHHELILPHFIARHQKELHLSAKQENFIKDQIQQTQTSIANHEWDLAKMVSQLEEILNQNPVNEEQALAMFDDLLELEATIKRIRFKAMLRINNILDKDQLDALRSLKVEH
ncbi:MAG: hypothetical protein K9K79_03865 [Desulfohalobiaceae bacterium]|nr:hypothetical protein [Desulfohalobiaceae bacterium]